MNFNIIENGLLALIYYILKAAEKLSSRLKRTGLSSFVVIKQAHSWKWKRHIDNTHELCKKLSHLYLDHDKNLEQLNNSTIGILKIKPYNNKNQKVKKSLRNPIEFWLNIFQPKEHSWIQVREITRLQRKKKNKKKIFHRRLTSFFFPTWEFLLAWKNKTKQKHSRNQSELTNYSSLPWKRNIPYTMPNSN